MAWRFKNYPTSNGSLGWKFQTLAFENFSDIEIEEIAVEDSLYNAGNHSNDIEESFEVETVDPVEEVQSTVWSQSEQVVAGDTFSFARLGDHEELREDSHRLQVDGESP